MTIMCGAERLADTWSAEAPAQAADLSAMTVAQLRALCEERGIDAPKKATKAQLTALLGE